MAFKEEVQSSTIQNINCDKALRWDGGVSENHQKCWLAAHWLPALLKSQHGKKGCCVPSVRCSSSGTDLPLLWPLSYTQTLHLQLQLRHILAKALEGRRQWRWALAASLCRKRHSKGRSAVLQKVREKAAALNREFTSSRRSRVQSLPRPHHQTVPRSRNVLASTARSRWPQLVIKF